MDVGRFSLACPVKHGLEYYQFLDGNPTMRLPKQFLAKLSDGPAVYALYGGRTSSKHPAYVGVADRLKRRIVQHLVKRDSSVTTMTSAACLNPDYITRVVWWWAPGFDERVVLEAAELVAFQHFNPALRSLAPPAEEAKQLSRDPAFEDRMYLLFKGPPTGQVQLPSLHEALHRLEVLELRVKKLEVLLKQQFVLPPKKLK
jgi:hypothetical protein